MTDPWLIPSPVPALRQARERVSGARALVMLDVVIEHIVAELESHDIDQLMATMVAEPRFRYFGIPGLRPLNGYREVRDYYLESFSIGKGMAGMDYERMEVGASAVVVEGYTLLAGAMLPNKFPAIATSIDLSRPCVLKKRTCILLPFEGDKMLGEHVYYDGPYRADEIRYLD